MAETTTQLSSKESFEEFYTEVKEIEKRDSSLTPKLQIERLNRPGCSYFNLNPFDVLQVDPDIPMNEIKKKYRQLSLLCHPDKNPDDADRAQKAFEAINKSYKTLANEEGFKRCQEIVVEAKARVVEMMKDRKKKLKKEGKPQVVDEDDPAKAPAATKTAKAKAKASKPKTPKKPAQESGMKEVVAYITAQKKFTLHQLKVQFPDKEPHQLRRTVKSLMTKGTVQGKTITCTLKVTKEKKDMEPKAPKAKKPKAEKKASTPKKKAAAKPKKAKTPTKKPAAKKPAAKKAKTTPKKAKTTPKKKAAPKKK